MKKPKELRSVGIKIDSWKAASDYCHKHGMTLTDLVSAAIEYAIQSGLRIERNVTVNTKDKQD